MGLSYRQELFLDYYIECGVGSHACEKAGYRAKNLSKTANRLLKLPEIKEAIAKRREAIRKRLQLSREDVEEKLASISESAKRESDQIRSLEVLSKIKGYIKPDNTQTIAVFGDRTKELDSKLTNRLEVEEQDFREFKAKVTLEGKTLKEKIIEFIREYIRG